MVAFFGRKLHKKRYKTPFYSNSYVFFRTDYLEQDIVLSKDAVPIVLHDVYLDTVSNVATEFPNRQRDDGRYYALDFTFEELKSLRLSERFHHESGAAVYPKRYPVGFGEYRIVSLREELAFIQNLRKPVGIYPEIKAPRWHRNQGYDISPIVLSMLEEFAYTSGKQAIYLQCFDAAELQRIRFALAPNLPLIQLIAGSEWAHPHEYQLLGLEDLASVAEYAQGIGPWVPLLLKQNGAGLHSTGLVEQAHQYGLAVHPYTLRHDAMPPFSSDFVTLLDSLFKTLKVDGAFTDFPDVLRGYIDGR